MRVFETLFGMKLEFSRVAGGHRRKSPGDLGKFIFIVKTAEGPIGKRPQIEIRIPNEDLASYTRRAYAFGTEQTNSTSHVFHNSRHDVAP